MKIAVLSSHTPSLFWFRMDMMIEFINRGYDVVAIGNEDEDKWQNKFNEYGIRYIKANISRNGTNPINDLNTLKSLKSILKKEKPEKVFSFQAKTIIYGNIAAHSLGIKEIYSLIAGMGSIFLSDDVKTKIIRSILIGEYKLSLRYCNKIFFQNDDDVELFNSYNIIDKNKVVLIPGSGVNLDKYKVHKLPSEVNFLCISRLIKDKGINEYLQAARSVRKDYPNARFVLVGPYDSNPSAICKQEIQEYIDQNTIEYYGETEDVRPYLENCSVYVLPSYREGTPKTVLEAMATGRAIITTNAPGCKETVVDGYNGYLVPIKNVEALKDKMIEFINNIDLVKQMAINSRKMAEEKFDVRLVNDIICKTMEI